MVKVEAKKAVMEWAGVRAAQTVGFALDDEAAVNPATMEDFSPTEKAALTLLAQGTPRDVITKSLGLEDNELTWLLESKDAFVFVSKVQESLGMTPVEQIAKLAPLAVQAKMQLLLHGSEKERAAASTFIIEQAVGKALQRNETVARVEVTDARAIESQIEIAQRRLQAIEASRAALQRSAVDAEVVE